MEYEIKEFYRHPDGKGTVIYDPETFVLTVINEHDGQAVRINVGPCGMLQIAERMTRAASEIFQEEKR
mgnify:CR=1 FL=1